MADRVAMLIRQREIVTLGGRLVGIQIGTLRQRAIVTSGGRLGGRQGGNVNQAESNSHLGWQTGR